jgi:hypothetical protein
VTSAARIGFLLVTGVLGACSEAPLDVRPGEADDDEEAGKADGASSQKAELKVVIDSAQIRRARSRLSLLNAQSETRRIWFYDSPTLALFDAGVILRAREIDGDEDDSTVKLRPFEMSQLATRFRTLDDLKCEIDRDPDSESTACSLKSEVGEQHIADVGDHLRQVRGLFSAEQEDLLATHGPGLTPTDCERLGPIAARVWTIETDALPKKLTAELWYMPDGGQVLELSMKVDAAKADEGMDDLLEFVDDRGLDLDAVQGSKTKRALDALVGAPVQQY